MSTGENSYHSCPPVTSHKRAEHTAKNVYKLEKVYPRAILIYVLIKYIN